MRPGCTRRLRLKAKSLLVHTSPSFQRAKCYRNGQTIKDVTTADVSSLSAKHPKGNFIYSEILEEGVPGFEAAYSNQVITFLETEKSLFDLNIHWLNKLPAQGMKPLNEAIIAGIKSLYSEEDLSSLDLKTRHFVFEPFNRLARSEALSHLNQSRLERLKSSLSRHNVWKIIISSGSVGIFFFTNEQAEKAKESEFANVAKTALLAELDDFDEFDALRTFDELFWFDSKEILEVKYDGSLQNYFR